MCHRDKGRILNRKFASDHEDDTPAECSMSKESAEAENKLLRASLEVKLQRECPENLRCYCSLTRTTCSRFPDTFFFQTEEVDLLDMNLPELFLPFKEF